MFDILKIVKRYGAPQNLMKVLEIIIKKFLGAYVL